MDIQIPDQALKELEAFLAREIAAGFKPVDLISLDAVDCFSLNYAPAAILFQTGRLLAELLEHHFQQQARWPKVTDCDRLDAAFAALEHHGIICGQNLLCCSTCAWSDMDRLMQQARASGRMVRGYTFYHEQDTDRAVNGHGLHLDYGGLTENDEQTALAIGNEVVGQIIRHGLTVMWSGNWSERIFVKLDWKRRRPLER